MNKKTKYPLCGWSFGSYRWPESNISYVVAQQFQLLIALVVLLPEVLVLLLQLAQFISDPLLDSSCFRLDLPSVLQSQLPLQFHYRTSDALVLTVNSRTLVVVHLRRMLNQSARPHASAWLMNSAYPLVINLYVQQLYTRRIYYLSSIV